jgi:hypothetical protein
MSKQVRSKLSKPGFVLCLTHGEGYSIEPGGNRVPRKIGDTLTGADLFGCLVMPKTRELLTPNEDGLFPGFSQTWKAQEATHG